MKNLKHCIAFYNVENLFDVKDNRGVLDKDFTPYGAKKWNVKRLHKKIHKIGATISQIGLKETGNSPDLVGLAEIENKNILDLLLTKSALKKLSYKYVHFNSPDERGIDTALLYNPNNFKVIESEVLPLLITNQLGSRDYTRDILYLHGLLNEEEVHVFVNHWPSRRAGIDETEPKRIKAAQIVKEKITQINALTPGANFIIMGDFNDNPQAPSLQMLLDTQLLINPIGKLYSPATGTAYFKGRWSLFDQIIISHSFLNIAPKTHTYQKAQIFAPNFLKNAKGRFKGKPHRTFIGNKYLGGYSDHFPVYILLKKYL